MCCCMIEIPSVFHGNLRLSCVLCCRQSSEFSENAGLEKYVRFSDNFRGIFGNLGKINKKSPLVCLYDKRNNTWPLADMEFLLSCLARYKVEHSKKISISTRAHVLSSISRSVDKYFEKKWLVCAVSFTARIDIEANHQFSPQPYLLNSNNNISSVCDLQKSMILVSSKLSWLKLIGIFCHNWASL